MGAWTECAFAWSTRGVITYNTGICVWTEIGYVFSATELNRDVKPTIKSASIPNITGLYSSQ